MRHFLITAAATTVFGGITGVGPCQCLRELWADEGGKSVLHAGSPLGARPRLWQLGGMPEPASAVVAPSTAGSIIISNARRGYPCAFR